MTQTKAESSKVIQVETLNDYHYEGFDKGVGDEHLFSPKLLQNSTATGESEILYVPLPSKSLSYKPLNIHIESWWSIYNVHNF